MPEITKGSEFKFEKSTIGKAFTIKVIDIRRYGKRDDETSKVQIYYSVNGFARTSPRNPQEFNEMLKSIDARQVA